MKDGRRHNRVPFVGPVRLSWEDSRGETRFAQAKCIDICESGMRIESPVPIESGRGIVLNAERVSVAGAATVKHVARYADRYIIGLELAQVAGSKALAALRQPWELRGPASLV